MKELSVEKQIYLCKYHDVDTALGNTMGLRAEDIKQILEKLKANGLYEQYRKMDEFEYERVVKAERNKTKSEKILDKYKFDKSKSTYERMKQVINECANIKDVTKLNITLIYRKIADKNKVKYYVIANDCKRAIDKAYEENEELFMTSGYVSKPTLKEFIAKELRMKVTQDIIEDDIDEVNGNKQFPEAIKTEVNKIKIDSTIMIQIPIEQMYEYYYLKGFLDATEGNNLRKFD